VDLVLGRDPVDLGGRVDPDLGDQDLAVRDPADRVGLGGRADLAPGRAPGDRAGRVDLGLADRGDRADTRGRVAPVDLGLADLGPGDRVDRADTRGRVDPVDLADRVDLDLGDQVDLGLADTRGQVDPGDRVDLGGRADLGLGGRAGLAVRVERRRRTRPGVLTTGVAPRWAAPGMRPTASAHPATVRRLRPHNTDGAGMAGLRPERRRLTGTGRRLRVAGMVLRLPVVGTAHGMGRRAT
jgi:hypothetical protein